MKTAEMIAKILTSPDKDTVVRINLNPRAFYDINMLISDYFRYAKISENSSYEFVNDIGIYLLQRGFLNTLIRPVFDLKLLDTFNTCDTAAFTHNTIYQGNLMVDGNMSLMLYNHGRALPDGFLNNLATPTCIIISNSSDDRALIFAQYTDEHRITRSIIRTNIKLSEIHFISANDGFTTEAITAIVKLGQPSPAQFRNPNYNTCEDKAASSYWRHYARQHNIPGELPPNINNLIGIHPHFNPAFGFQPNHSNNNLAEIQGIIQRLQYDLLTLTNRMNNIEAKVLLKTNVADDVSPIADTQLQQDKRINEDMLDAADIRNRAIRNIELSNFPIPNVCASHHHDNQITTHLDALATEIAKISQRLEHLENSVYNKTSNDVIKPEPSLGYPSND